ncbi:RNA helicase-like protein [Operophtera brumata]|uniref:RNA helicase n=1 Tax=Operophtera brumata TaxID=104452 RepID=A0A0L7LGB0_OPEBR|nr:RNA helicase-like protein [Operophtera brumata]
MSNKQCLVIKEISKYEDESPSDEDEHTETRRGGNINWEDDSEIKNYDKIFETSGNFNKSYGSSRNSSRSDECSRNVTRTNRIVPVDQTDLNDGINYNDYIQSKQENTELLELPKLRGGGKNSIVEQNDSEIISIPFVDATKNENKENETPLQKPSRSKLLDFLQKRKVPESKLNDSSSNDDNSVVHQTKLNDTKTSKSSKEQDSDDDDLEEIHCKLDLKQNPIIIDTKLKTIHTDKAKVHVNPYKNLDGSKSVFVEDLIQPLLLAHSKNETKILPQSSLRDIPFKVEIHNTLRNMQVKGPSRLQSVSWPYILRGHSMIMISAAGSGKTLGHLPAVCNLVLDYNFDFSGLGPICIIVCATALSVNNVARDCRMFLNHQRVLACFPGVDNTKLVTDLINGCDILVSTPSILYRLLGAEIGVDLRRLTTLVFEDCERLSQVYELEIKAMQLYVKQMLKSRTDKQVKVQYIVASRKWCNFMNRLAKNAPDTIVTFAAFHECVLYSKTKTSVSFVKKNKKVDAVVEFLKETDDSKLTVIVCRSDDEVELLESTLTRLNLTVVACNNQMTIHDLYKIRTAEFGSILICCDGNLNHLKVTNANYLVHFSLPAYFTQFCARFAVLNEKYPSIFGPANENVKIKILLEETNVEQLPKILNFVKRCSSTVPEVLNEVARKVLAQKDLAKAEKLVPICDSLLSLGECADMYTCQERHAILEGFDEPKTWMPGSGIITFKIIHYHSAISYSARLLTHVTGTNKKKYPETYATLCMRLGMFFSKEKSKRLHGDPKVGDICAVSVRKNFIARCQVLKIKDLEKGLAKHVVINLIDEEQIAVIRAVELYYLPEEFKAVETHVVKVRLANIKPQDKDVTFSELAMNKLKKLTDDDEQLYLKGKVAMAVGNTIFVETLEACEDLSALVETVVKYNFKQLLLDTHAIPHSEHLSKLQKLCEIGNLKLRHEPETIETAEIKTSAIKKETEHRWAHLDKNNWSEVIFSNTINAEKIFVRPQKFDKCVNSLISDIRKYVEENPKPIENVCVKDIVLAEYPDDSVYERAIIEEIIDDSKVHCFFVDNADWRDVAISKLKPIPQKFIKQIPFQSIECRLIGVKPHGEEWTEFSTNWLHDNCSQDDTGNTKITYVKYFTKEKAEVTGGHKYGVILVDTTTEVDVVINKRMIETNLAAVEPNESEYLEKPLDFVREKTDTSSFEEYLEELQNIETTELQINNLDKKRSRKELIPIPIKLIPNQYEKVEWETNDFHEKTAVIDNNNKIRPYVPINKPIEDVPRVPLKSIFAEQPIRSFPLVSDSDEDSDKWDVCLNDEDLGKYFGLPKLSQSYNDAHKIKNYKSELSGVVPSKRENATSTPQKNSGTTNTEVSTAYFKSPAKSNKIIVFGADKKLEKKCIETVNGAVANETDTGTDKILARREINEKSITEVIDGEVLETTNDTGNLKGKIKDASLYDSDDTLSITNDKIEIAFEEKNNKRSVYKNEPSVLDSDDTQSFSTENYKEVGIEEPKKELHNTGLDSDDSDITDLQDVPERPRVVDKIVKSTNAILNINKAIQIVEDMKVKDDKLSEKTKMQRITISEIPKTGIATKDNSPVNINKAESNTYVSVGDDQTRNTGESIKFNELKGKTITVTESSEPVRTPQLVWRQDKYTITIKIKLVVDEYSLETGNRSLKFSAYQNEVKYAFDIELYGVIESEKTKHSNKGQYILVTLVTMLKKCTKWLKLTKDSIKNWILYDVDSIDTSSDEEATCNDDALKVIMDHHEKAMELDNDVDIDDSPGYRYRDDD